MKVFIRFSIALCTGSLRLLPAVCCLTFITPAQYRFDHWTTDNGLPHNSIRALRQTRDGYFWLTTGDGLARFDGARFRVFNRANTPELTSNNFSFFALHQDRQGALWAGTTNGGVIRYDNGVFTAYTTRDGLASNSVHRIDEDAAGTVWFFTSEGLAQWRDGRLIRVAPVPGSPFNDYLTAPKNVGGDAYFFGLWRRDPAGWQRFAYGQWMPLPLPPRLTPFPEKLRIDSIIEDSQRRLWYDVADREDEFYGVIEGRLSVFHGSGFPGIGRARDVNVCYQDRQGRLLVGDLTGQVALWQEGQRLPLTGLATSDVFRVWEDHEGGLWIGTKNEGLYRLREPTVTVFRHPGGTGFNAIIATLPDRENSIWLGCAYLGGLSRFNAGRYENFYRPGVARTAFANIVSALFADHDDALWLGTWDGVARFYPGRRSWVEEKGLSAQLGKQTRLIYRDRPGALWFGSDNEMARLGKDGLTHYTSQQGLGGSARAVFEDHTGALWVSTSGGL
jgi:ligand-binding sensor domain-containing protein